MHGRDPGLDAGREVAMKPFTTLYDAMVFGSQSSGPCSVLVNSQGAFNPKRFDRGVFECDGACRALRCGWRTFRRWR